MPSQAMRDLIDGFRDRQKEVAIQAPKTLGELRDTFAPAGRLHPMPEDVLVTEVSRWWGAGPLACRSEFGRRKGAPLHARRRL